MSDRAGFDTIITRLDQLETRLSASVLMASPPSSNANEMTRFNGNCEQLSSENGRASSNYGQLSSDNRRASSDDGRGKKARVSSTWEAKVDPIAGSVYYRNTTTNETSECPPTGACFTNALPPPDEMPDEAYVAVYGDLGGWRPTTEREKAIAKVFTLFDHDASGSYLDTLIP